MLFVFVWFWIEIKTANMSYELWAMDGENLAVTWWIIRNMIMIYGRWTMTQIRGMWVDLAMKTQSKDLMDLNVLWALKLLEIFEMLKVHEMVNQLGCPLLVKSFCMIFLSCCCAIMCKYELLMHKDCLSPIGKKKSTVYLYDAVIMVDMEYDNSRFYSQFT